MARIKLLDKTVSELIAAGEVIERPASIVKELIENSIDAGSTAITVEIKRGGISYIRITDNGCGIEAEDMPVAFMRHATSKILASDDLESIGTLGFRGEALASISAVSRVEMISKTESSQFGTKVAIEADVHINTDDIGCSTGTTIIVRDLFFNVPVRLKFLKKDQSEAIVICGIVDKLALSHPEISFKLISDNKIRLHTAGNGDMLSSIHAVLGKEFSSSLIPVDYELEGIKVNGYISKTTATRSNRGMQHFFVNERYVRSKTCIAAIEEGYKNSVMTGKFPFCVLDIQVPFNLVDVNVHPAKIEVRFVNERSVFDAVYFAVKSALSLNDELADAVKVKSSDVEMMKPMSQNLLSGFKNEKANQIAMSATNVNPVLYEENSTDDNTKRTSTAAMSVDYTQSIHQMQSPVINDKHTEYESRCNDNLHKFDFINSDKLIRAVDNRPIIKREQPIEEPIEVCSNTTHTVDCTEQLQMTDKLSELPMRMLGELFKTYVLFEVEDKFILLDKHAAHERVLYNKLKISVSTYEKQLLLKPVIVNLSTDEFNVLLDKQDILNSMGFCYEEFGNHTISLREVPLMLAEYDCEEILLDIANKLALSKHDTSSDRFEDILHSIACRSAIKANDINSKKELEELMRIVINDSDIRHCPHGRPVFTILTKYDIEKIFGRS